MSQIVNKRIFYVSSGSLLNGTDSSFDFKVQISDTQAFDRITLLQCTLPISYYLIQQGLNSFIFNENGTAQTLTIQPGTYNAISFAVEIASLLTSKSPGNFTYTCSFPNNYSQVQTGKFTWTVNTGLPVSFTFLSNPINQQFGFNYQATVTFSSGSGTSSLTSANVVSFVPENTIFIHSNAVAAEGNNNFSDVLQDVQNGNNIPFSVISWKNPSPLAYSKKLSSDKIQNIRFSFTDESGLPIYFNGQTVVMSIMIYKDPVFYTQAASYMRFQLERQKEQDDDAELE